jgi:REP element-mobilizing transposase RayT
MANSYSQIHIQFVYAVQYRAALIQHSWKERLHQYLTGIVHKNKHKMLQVNSMADHIHLLIGFRPYQSISAFIQNMKTESTKWINNNHFTNSPFAWQEGFGAFSYSKKDLPDVINYIKNQEVHHRKKTFIEEYMDLLKEFEIEYDERYIFKPVL